MYTHTHSFMMVYIIKKVFNPGFFQLPKTFFCYKNSWVSSRKNNAFSSDFSSSWKRQDFTMLKL